MNYIYWEWWEILIIGGIGWFVVYYLGNTSSKNYNEEKKKCPKCNSKLHYAGNIKQRWTPNSLEIYYCKNCKWRGTK